MPPSSPEAPPDGDAAAEACGPPPALGAEAGGRAMASHLSFPRPPKAYGGTSGGAHGATACPGGPAPPATLALGSVGASPPSESSSLAAQPGLRRALLAFFFRAPTVPTGAAAAPRGPAGAPAAVPPPQHPAAASELKLKLASGSLGPAVHAAAAQHGGGGAAAEQIDGATTGEGGVGSVGIAAPDGARPPLTLLTTLTGATPALRKEKADDEAATVAASLPSMGDGASSPAIEIETGAAVGLTNENGDAAAELDDVAGGVGVDVAGGMSKPLKHSSSAGRGEGVDPLASCRPSNMRRSLVPTASVQPSAPLPTSDPQRDRKPRRQCRSSLRRRCATTSRRAASTVFSYIVLSIPTLSYDIII